MDNNINLLHTDQWNLAEWTQEEYFIASSFHGNDPCQIFIYGIYKRDIWIEFNFEWH